MVASGDVVSATDRQGGLTRRGFVRAGAGAGVAALAASAGGDALIGALAPLRVNQVLTSVSPADPDYASRPDLRIPGLSVATLDARAASDPIFIAPYNAPGSAQYGAVVTDNTGAPIWEHPLPSPPAGRVVTANFQVQRFDDRPALTWWDGLIENGHGVGEYTIAGDDYATIRRVQAANGLRGDLHEFSLTARGTVLLTSYAIVVRDLRSVGGNDDGRIQDAIFQEIDLASGRVLLEWHSLDHIPLSESYWPVYEPWDYVHINSIDVDTDGQLLVSSRNTHTVYKIDRRSGEIIWRLGGPSNQFDVAPDAVFAWQHDVRRQPDGTMTVFDNEGPPHGGPESRAIVLNVDEKARTSRLVREYRHPSPLLATSQGSVQLLPNGNVFVGWGAEPFVSEFTAAGELVFDAQLGKDYLSYRAYRLPWHGVGEGSPAVAAKRVRGGGIEIFASWNGDTRTRFWVVLAGGSSGDLLPAAARPRDGFETALVAHGGARRIAVRALDYGGRVLGQSPTVSV